MTSGPNRISVNSAVPCRIYADSVSRYFFPKNDVFVRVVCFVEDEPPVLSVYSFPKKSLFSRERDFTFPSEPIVSLLISEKGCFLPSNTCGFPRTTSMASALVPKEPGFILRFAYKLTDAVIGFEYRPAEDGRCALCPKWFVLKQLAAIFAPFW